MDSIIPVKNNHKIRPNFLLLTVVYGIALCFFYMKYVPIVKSFQISLIPILSVVFILSTLKPQWGILSFIFFFPLINNLPYFFGIAEPIPHAPTALVLFLLFFLGWLVHNSFSKPTLTIKHNIFKPLILFSLIIFVSAIITIFRYTNFLPFISDSVYELVTNVDGVTAGGAIMSTIFFSLNYLTGFAFFFILVNTVESKELVKNIVIILCSSTFLSLSFGFFQHFNNMKFGNNPISIRMGMINATFKDALSFGVYIAIITPLLLGAVFYFKRRARIFPFIALVLSLYIIFFIGSKSGFLCIFISLLIFLALFIILISDLIKFKAISLKKVALSVLVVVLLILISVGSFIIFKEDILLSRTIRRLRLIPKGGVDGLELIERANLWKTGIYMIKDYPFTGIGMGGYIIEVANYTKKHKATIGVPQSAENYFIQVGSELGITGLILVIWIFWEIVKQMRRSYGRFPSDDKNKFIIIGAIAGVISYIINIQFHTYIGSYEIKFTFWLLVGLIFCMGKVEREEEDSEEKIRISKTYKFLILFLIILFSGVHLWNSSHSLSLKSRTEKFGLEQDFGLYKTEKTNDGREFRWTRSYGGLTIKIEKPVIEIPLLASHPDIRKNPVKVKIYLIKDFFKQKKLLDEIILTESRWKSYPYFIPEEVNQEVILLLKVSRTWNPHKILGTPDRRNLGVALGDIHFRDNVGIK